MQVYVQKLASTTFPRRPAGVSGGELSQPVAPPKEGSSPSTGSEAEAVCSPAGANQGLLMTMPPRCLLPGPAPPAGSTLRANGGAGGSGVPPVALSLPAAAGVSPPGAPQVANAVPHGPREDAAATGGERRCLGPAGLRRAHRGKG